jgi:phosphoribosylanthranilate isomerase
MALTVKICGVNSHEALEAAIGARADWIGLVFFERSPRNVSLAEAARLARAAAGRVKIVALLVDPDDETLEAIIGEISPDFIQLHGGESPERVLAIRNRFGAPVIKAVKVGSLEDAASANLYKNAANFILFDAKPGPARAPSALPGGNGAAFDWPLIADWRGRSDFVLSGGLNPDNVQAAIEATGATAVDVSSGVETAPGRKSPELIRRFIAAARAVSPCSPDAGPVQKDR